MNEKGTSTPATLAHDDERNDAIGVVARMTTVDMDDSDASKLVAVQHHALSDAGGKAIVLTASDFWTLHAAASRSTPTQRAPDVTQSLDAAGLMREMVAQARLGHRQFCVGVHPQTEDHPEEAEWEDWSLTFDRLAARVVGTQTASTLGSAAELLNRVYQLRDWDVRKIMSRLIAETPLTGWAVLGALREEEQRHSTASGQRAPSGGSE